MKLKILISVLLLVVIFIIGCKKFDLERLAKVTTGSPMNVSYTSVGASGVLVDLGEDEDILEYGFCLSANNFPPTLENKATPPFNPTNTTGDFTSNISGLGSNLDYQMRAYLIENSGDVTYGNVVEFKTLYSGGSPEWLHYDNGVNHTSVGLTEGGSFDIAIRFPTNTLGQYNGMGVEEIRFFPTESSPTEYSLTLWEGSDPPNLIHIQSVNLIADQWNYITPSYIYVINSSNEFWAGIWVQNHPAGTHPAGCDEGPAETGKGDMISFDDGESWEALSISNPALDYNWNLQVWVTLPKGDKIQMVRELPSVTKENKASRINTNHRLSSSELNK